MSNVVKEKLKIYETVLSSPGMNEKCKVSVHLSRQTIVFLCRLIEKGLIKEKSEPDDIINLLPEESLNEVQGLVPEFLKKSGLTEFYDKLKSL